jgi:hypothetical protein
MGEILTQMWKNGRAWPSPQASGYGRNYLSRRHKVSYIPSGSAPVLSAVEIRRLDTTATRGFKSIHRNHLSTDLFMYGVVGNSYGMLLAKITAHNRCFSRMRKIRCLASVQALAISIRIYERAHRCGVFLALSISGYITQSWLVDTGRRSRKVAESVPFQTASFRESHFRGSNGRPGGCGFGIKPFEERTPLRFAGYQSIGRLIGIGAEGHHTVTTPR